MCVSVCVCTAHLISHVACSSSCNCANWPWHMPCGMCHVASRMTQLRNCQSHTVNRAAALTPASTPPPTPTPISTPTPAHIPTPAAASIAVLDSSTKSTRPTKLVLRFRQPRTPCYSPVTSACASHSRASDD